VAAVIAVVDYFTARQVNPVTTETQNISISPEQEIGLGRQALPQMESQFGGQSADQQCQTRVDQVDAAIVQSSEASGAPYPSSFMCLPIPDHSCFRAPRWSDFPL
jgi:predicted Zn-dependent protease